MTDAGAAYVDANAIVPYLSGRDPTLLARARAVIDVDEPRILPITVILEAAFVLRTVFGYRRRDIASAIHDLLSRANIETAELPKDAVIAAIGLWRDGAIGSAGDALIVACLQTHEAGRFFTFDLRFPRDLGWDVVSP
jgi:predicted nucleic acid-binding protein